MDGDKVVQAKPWSQLSRLKPLLALQGSYENKDGKESGVPNKSTYKKKYKGITSCFYCLLLGTSSMPQYFPFWSDSAV